MKKIQKPLFYLWGEHDPLVSYKWSLNSLQEEFPQGLPSHITYYIAPQQNHSFQISEFGPENNSPKTYSEETKNQLENWIIQQIGIP